MYLNKTGLQTSTDVTCFAEAYMNIDPIDAIAIGLAEAETEYTKIQTATIMAEYESISKNDGNYEIIQEGAWETIKKWWAQFVAFLKRMWDSVVNFFKELFGSEVKQNEKKIADAKAANPNATVESSAPKLLAQAKQTILLLSAPKNTDALPAGEKQYAALPAGEKQYAAPDGDVEDIKKAIITITQLEAVNKDSYKLVEDLQKKRVEHLQAISEDEKKLNTLSNSSSPDAQTQARIDAFKKIHAENIKTNSALLSKVKEQMKRLLAEIRNNVKTIEHMTHKDRGGSTVEKYQNSKNEPVNAEINNNSTNIIDRYMSLV